MFCLLERNFKTNNFGRAAMTAYLRSFNRKKKRKQHDVAGWFGKTVISSSKS